MLLLLYYYYYFLFSAFILAWPFVNFDVCLIAFVMYLLNGVPFQFS